jgi:hypothetical protein
MFGLLFSISLSSQIYKSSYRYSDDEDWNMHDFCNKLKVILNYLVGIFSDILEIWDLTSILHSDIKNNWHKYLLLSKVK